jgi:hypothetical protein
MLVAKGYSTTARDIVVRPNWEFPKLGFGSKELTSFFDDSISASNSDTRCDEHHRKCVVMQRLMILTKYSSITGLGFSVSSDYPVDCLL